MWKWLLDSYDIDPFAQQSLFMLSQMSERGHLEAVGVLWTLRTAQRVRDYSAWLNTCVINAYERVRQAAMRKK